MRIQIPSKKIQKLKSRISQLQLSQTPKSCWWIASLLGKDASMVPAIGYVLLHIARCLDRSSNNWEAKCILSKQSQMELSWWKEWIERKNGLLIQKGESCQLAVTIWVNAPDSDWGVHSSYVTTNGFWSQDKWTLTINSREPPTIIFVLQLHVKRFKNSTIRIFSDNITAIKYVSKPGETASEHLQDMTIQLHELRNKYQLDPHVLHIPGILNIQADKLSRNMLPLYEWTLPRRWFQHLQHIWGKRRMKIDAFVSRINHGLPTYWNPRPDPLATATDAFQQNWSNKGLYLNPPWRLILKVIRWLCSIKVQDTVLITPLWSTLY